MKRVLDYLRFGAINKILPLTYDDSLSDYVAEKAVNGQSGARDIRNFIRKEVEDKITSEIISAKGNMISAVHATATNDGVNLQII